jgi:hypothetical protein
MAQVGRVQASVGNVPGGFCVSMELRRGDRLDTWRVNLVTEIAAAEEVVRLFAEQHGVPWKDVEIVTEPKIVAVPHRVPGNRRRAEM